ncbi:transglycosylase domain-containing protein [Anaeroselena agilis]|uniref:Penicillin-binding protein 1A n=1 Tax=Anaeroselena agilis TaxID=3063788 RepID=A0ABU3NVY8_9FIRM|nr:penicillin-binding protein 1A [Selenomonadales bacterium 4137-cl]
MSTDSSHKAGNSRRSTGRWLTVAAIAIIVFIVMITGAGLGFLTASIHTMPSLNGEIRPAASSQIFDINGRLITTIHSVENRLPVPLSKMPKDLQNAFVATEDARFYQHIGVDPRAILRAVFANIVGGGVSEGGSTITQQLARNALLSQEQTLKRKIQEAVLAVQIERQYTKAEILELYLNQIYFGQGAYGVQAAAWVYFGKNVENLNLAECALLAGIPKSPNYYSPLNNLKAAKERQSVVLDQMVKYNYVSRDTANKAKSAELKLASRSPGSGGQASYFVDYVTQLLIDKYGADAVYKDGLKVYTSLDLSMQQAAEKAMGKLPTYRTDAKGNKEPQGALVAIDPRNGQIKAMVGGRGTDQFNRAVLAERQPGSAFKPFVYLAAIESGMTPATIVEDKPVTFGNYSPTNYDHRFRGRVTLRTALENSLNVVAVKLAHQVGPEKPLYYAQQMGITTLVTRGPVNDVNLAMALGGLTRGVTPLELASAYGVLANGGVRVEPTAILRVVDRAGRVLDQHRPQAKAVVNERSAYLLTDMMRGVITRGTGGGANIGRPAAGKTGTTSDYKDAWFVGFTPDIVAAVWMGFDTPEYLNGVTGGDIPATIWHDFMMAALEKKPVSDFARPSGIVSASVSPKDGSLADPKNKDAQSEIFIEGTQPKPRKPAPENISEDKPAPADGGRTLPPPPAANKPAVPAPPVQPAAPVKPELRHKN